jgi:hypothetical protein
MSETSAKKAAATSLRRGLLAAALQRAGQSTGNENFKVQSLRISSELARRPSPAASLREWESYLEALNKLPSSAPNRYRKIETARQQIAAKRTLN